MAHDTADGELRATLRKIKQYGGLADLAVVCDVAKRTLYRHAEDDAEGAMDPGTRRPLTKVFVGLGLVGDYGVPEIVRAVDTLEGMAKRAATASDRAADLALDDAVSETDGRGEGTGSR
jgi:hypothetical protein